MKTPAAAPGTSEDAMPQVHPRAQQQQGRKHCDYGRITARCSALRKLPRVSLWENLRLVWTETLGDCLAHPAITRRLQLCLQGWRQWHSVYGIGPSERNGAHPFPETTEVFTPSWEHSTQDLADLPSSSAQIPGPKANCS